MSKIYEALLRAEQERNAATTQPPVQNASPAAVAEAAPEPTAQPVETVHAQASAVEPVAPPAPAPPAWEAAAQLPVPAFEPEPFAPEAALPSEVLPVAAAAAQAAPAVTVEPQTPAPAEAAPTPPEAAAAAQPAVVERATRPSQAVPPVAPVAAAPASTPLDERASAVSRASAAAAIKPAPTRINGITALPWKPNLASLPALQERGKDVEQFRSLRSRLQEYRDLNHLKSLLITSGLPQEGKSYIAANLAISFARHKGARVLLIDGDMRRGTANALLGTTHEPGLSEYLGGKVAYQDILQCALPPTSGNPLPGLSSLVFLPAGADYENAGDLSSSPRFAELITALAPSFDWIIVDSSPVNLVADGVNMGRVCDGVLLVAREGVTPYESAQRAVSELKAANSLGFVLNAVHTPPASGGYYGYDNYDKLPE